MSKIESILLALLLLFLPTQLGKHFWPSFSFVSGIRIDYLSPTIYFTDVLLVALACFFLFRVGIAYLLRMVQKNALLFFVSSVLFVSASVSLRPLLGVYQWSKFVLFTFLALYIIRYIRTKTQMVVIALLFAISSFFESLLALFQFLSQGSLNGWLYYLGERAFTGATPGIANANIDGVLMLRPYATFSHPNVLAGYLLISTLLINFFLLKKLSKTVTIIGICIIVCNSIAIILSLSRVVIVLWFLFLFIWFLWYLIQEKRHRIRLLTAGIVGVFLGVLLMPILKILVFRYTQTNFGEEAFVLRVQLIKDAINLLQQHPFLGVGPGNFIPALSLDHVQTFAMLQPVHNIYLLVAAETGIFGLFFFGGLIIDTIFNLIKKYRKAQTTKAYYAVFLLLFITVLILGMFDHYLLTLQQGQLLCAFIIGLCWIHLHE